MSEHASGGREDRHRPDGYAGSSPAPTQPHVLPCPRCGSDEIAHGYGGPPYSASVECYGDDCRAALIDFRSEVSAIQRWNSGEWNARIREDDDGFLVAEMESGYALR